MQQDGMRACNNDMNNASLRHSYGVMHVVKYALISCLAAYILSSSPVLLHICFSTFCHCHPYILQYFNVLLPLFTDSLCRDGANTPIKPNVTAQNSQTWQL